MITILTKTTKQGEAKLTIESSHYPVIEFTLAGKYIGSWQASETLVRTIKSITASNGDVCDHAIGNLALTTVEAETVINAIRTALNLYNQSQEIVTRKLRAQRQDLIDSISAIHDEISAQYERCYHQDCGIHGVSGLENELKEAQANLKAFDAINPEIAEAISARRKSDVQHFLETD